MIIQPTRSELATLAKHLNLPTIPPTAFLSALIDIYADYCDVTYEDILHDIDAEYLTYKDSRFIRKIITGDDKAKPSADIYGYLYYNDNLDEVCVAIY